ncbi:MAG TPA: replication-relaxation family protein [Solirubrobacteraceae bacterium]|nr:replication-relaxation family protein [Solirubrobacteraceae bacterium]
MRRVSVGRLVALAEGMSVRDRQIVEAVARLTLVSGAQLINLFFYDIPNVSTRARRARRVLGRLVEQRVLDRLEQRRRGGEGGGSAAWVYALGPAGRRIVAYWAGEGLPRSRGAHEPEPAWAAHTLAVGHLYVQLREAERGGRAELLAFDAEPTSWRQYTRLGGAAGVLKPDAYIRLGAGEFEDVFFAEVDLGSERRGQLLRQHRAYGEYFRSGVEQTATGVFPAVVWLVPDAQRAALLEDIHRGLPEQVRRLFTVVCHDQALAVLCGKTPGEAS